MLWLCPSKLGFVRKPHRKCYDTIDDCECRKGTFPTKFPGRALVCSPVQIAVEVPIQHHLSAEGQPCKGFNLATNRPFPDCRTGLQCTPFTGISAGASVAFTCEKPAPICCKAFTAKCQACAAGLTVQAFCEKQAFAGTFAPAPTGC